MSFCSNKQKNNFEKNKKTMNHEVFDELTALIDALRAETQANSITPERLGSIIQRIVDILPDLDDSAIAATVSSALTAAQSALTQAQAAISAAQAAEAAASGVVEQVASYANDIAQALSTATTAMRMANEAATAASAATARVPQRHLA